MFFGLGIVGLVRISESWEVKEEVRLTVLFCGMSDEKDDRKVHLEIWFYTSNAVLK